MSSRHAVGNNSKKKHFSWWCAACGRQHDWRAPNKILVVQIGADANRAKVFKAHAATFALCDDLINALKLLANQLKDGDSPTQSIVPGLQEKSRRGIIDGPRRFIEEDNHIALDVCGLPRGTKSVRVKEPKFSETFLEAAIRRVDFAG